MKHLAVLLALAAQVSTVHAQEKPAMLIGGERDAGYQMSDPEALFVSGNRIVVVESKAPYFRVLTKQGALVQSFGKSGGGPGEITSLSSVVYDSARKQLLIFDASASRVTYLSFNDTLAFIRTTPVAGSAFASCLIDGVPWTALSGADKNLIGSLEVSGDHLARTRSLGEVKWLSPDAAEPVARGYALSPGGVLACDSRTHVAAAMSTLFGEVHLIDVRTGVQKLQKILDFISMKVEAQPLRIGFVFPADGIYDALAGALVSRDGIEAVVARSTPLDKKRENRSVVHRRILLLPDGTQRVVATSTWRPMVIASDGIYCYASDPVPTIARYASGRCP